MDSLWPSLWCTFAPSPMPLSRHDSGKVWCLIVSLTTLMNVLVETSLSTVLRVRKCPSPQDEAVQLGVLSLGRRKSSMMSRLVST
ncbi:hypothetical protein BJX96DRAFT_150609 [Aspergillus floccosus]